jgi:hypothetical protein
MKRISVVLYFICLILVVSGCQKDRFDGGHRFFLNSQVALPAVVNGMLCFDDTTHFNDYYSFIENEVESLDESMEDFDLDSVLFSFESNFDNFLSLRENEYQMTESSDDPHTVISKDFIVDDVLKSILNSNHEVCIGGDVYVFFNQTDIYVIDDGNQSLVNQFQALTKGNSDLLVDHLSHQDVSLISSMHQHLKTSEIGGDEIKTQVEVTISAVDCDPYQKIIKLKVFSFDLNPAQLDAMDVTWEVDYGDGSTETLTGNNLWYIYTYSSDGPFYVKINCEYEDPNNPGEYITEPKNVLVHTIACSTQPASADKWHLNPQVTDYAISAVFNYTPEKMFVRSKLHAKTIAWKWHGQQGKWKRYRTSNRVGIEYVKRDRDQCNVIDDGTKTKTPRKRRTRRVNERARFGIYNHENTSDHTVVFPNQTLSWQLILLPCP